MATWRNRTGGMLQLEGFDEFIEAVKKTQKDVRDEGLRCFDDCTQTIFDTLGLYAKKSGLSEHLIDEITDDWTVNENRDIYYCEIGWKKQRPSKEVLPTFYKVMFYNYGTPSERFTKKGASRGIEPKHGFIKKAKISARRRCKTIQKNALSKMLKELE